MVETSGKFKRAGRYGRDEIFAGRESIVIDVSEEDKTTFIFRPISPESEAVNNAIRRALLAGSAVDKKAATAIYQRHGYKSVDELFSSVRMGRFTAKNDIPVRVVNDEGTHWLFDARLPEEYFPTRHTDPVT